MSDLKLKEVVSDALNVHPNGFPFSLILNSGAGDGRLKVTMVTTYKAIDLIIGDPTSVADGMDQLALTVGRMGDMVRAIGQLLPEFVGDFILTDRLLRNL